MGHSRSGCREVETELRRDGLKQELAELKRRMSDLQRRVEEIKTRLEILRGFGARASGSERWKGLLSA